MLTSLSGRVAPFDRSVSNDTKCKICDKNKIGDEFHYLCILYVQYFRKTAIDCSKSIGFRFRFNKHLFVINIYFECFIKCYNSLVQPIIDYGSSVWGTNGYSCVETVQYRACSYFLGLGKYGIKVY